MRLKPTALVALLVAAALIVTGCTAAAPSGPHPSDSAADHLRWGVPAQAAPKGITYQPDVRVVGGGRNVVWSASADGLHWTLDANAPGMSDVRVGDVLYASAMVAGRVAAITRTGDRDDVLMVPVTLTDIVRDGRLAIDDTFKSGDTVLSQRVDTPTVSTIPDHATAGDLAQAVSEVRPLPASIKVMPPPDSSFGVGGGNSFSVAGFEVGASFAPDGFNVTLTKNFGSTKTGANSSSGLKLGMDIGLHFDNWRLKGSQTITGGRITESSTTIDGLRAITLGMAGGAASPASDNTRYRFEVPWTFEKALPPIEGVPTVAQIKVSLVIETAFTGRNSTLTASAAWDVHSSPGNLLKQMALSVRKSLVDSIAGISLGPSGYVFGVGIRTMWGIGVVGLAAGPYARLAVTVGVSNGSALGASLVRCHGASLDITGGGGAAAYISTKGIGGVLHNVGSTLAAKFLRRDALQIEHEAVFDVSTQLVHRDVIVPDVPLCTSGT